jgi:hypothetical protein
MSHEKVPAYVEKVHEKTGIPIEEIKRMSWPKIEKALGIEIAEPPYEIKRTIRDYWARAHRWITSKEIDKLAQKVNRIIEKYSIC